MSRVKRGTQRTKKRRQILGKTKGYMYGRKNKIRQAKEAIAHAGNHAFSHRRDKKNVMRRGWQVAINAAVRPLGLSYSRFIGGLKKEGITVNRKMLAEMAQEHPESLERIVNKISS